MLGHVPFSRALREEALFRSRRCCCVCHNFAGLYEFVHHIVQEADRGPDTIDNAIALCAECHGQAGHYNPRHAIGNKYSPDELRRHRDEWWKYVATNPSVPLPKDPIALSPSGFSLPLAPGDERIGTISVNNKSDDFIYRVLVLVAITGATQADYEFVLGKPNSELEPLQVSSGAEWQAEVLCLSMISPFGQPIECLSVHTVSPRSVYELSWKMRVTKPVIGWVAVMLGGFSHDTTPFIQRPSATDPGGTETLTRVDLFGDSFWVGMSVKPG